MGRINLTALRVRRRALAELHARRIPEAPIWLNVITNNPPAQILTRQQPQQHLLTHIRTRTLPNGRTEQVALPVTRRKPKSAKASRLFAPVNITYEEDHLRKQFFGDHPWELARPRVVVETTGNQHVDSDYSKGLEQPGVLLSGESVVQRQLHLLQTVPDITEPEAYDIARREFYILRRQEATRKRIAREEAMHMGAEPEMSILQWSMKIENKHYDDWERWARGQVVEQMQRTAAFSGEILSAEDAALRGASSDASGRSQIEGDFQARRPTDPFVGERLRRAQINTA